VSGLFSSPDRRVHLGENVRCSRLCVTVQVSTSTSTTHACSIGDLPMRGGSIRCKA